MFNVSSTLCRAAQSRRLLIRSSSIVMTFHVELDVVSFMAVFLLAGLVAFSYLQFTQIRRPAPALSICAKDIARYPSLT
jgi:hypothetical protein